MMFNEKNEVLTKQDLKAIIVGVETKEDISYYMEELTRLAEAAGIEVAGEMVQKLERPNTAHYIGKGKLEELKEMCEALEVNMVIFNSELSGIQLRNIEEVIERIIFDRTTLILDIFSNRAVSKEGKLQVELAQLQYRIPRLVGFGKAMSRLGGGGTGGGGARRGAGETKLELDRRHILRRMDEIRREIEEIRQNRNTQRARRLKSEIPVVALVGYTNAGKSAVMNHLLAGADKEDKSVYEEDILFATLDTSQRNIRLDSKEEFILVDTVGFVSHLPHTLVKAFKATLEEVLYADLLVHVVDASWPDYAFHLQVTREVLKEIGADDKKIITAYNKIDLLKENGASDQLSGGEADPLSALSDKLPAGPDIVHISARDGTNMDELLRMIKRIIFADKVLARLLVPYTDGEISSYLCEKCKVLKMDYNEQGTYFEAEMQKADYSRLEKYSI
jgi:GTP-binding protein HflX